MHEKLCILLRDMRKGEIAVEVRAESDHGDIDELEVFRNFILAVKKGRFPGSTRFDVYIGYWGQQTTLHFPPAFFTLIHEKKWSVIFDLND